MNRIIVEVLGGVVCDVHSAEPIQVMIVDWDDIKQGDVRLSFTPADTEIIKRLEGLTYKAAFNAKLIDLLAEAREYQAKQEDMQ